MTFARIKLLLFSIPLTLSATFSVAQAPVFSTDISSCFGGSDNEEFYAGSGCLDGGYLLTGLSYSKDGDINPLAAYDSADAFVVRTNAQGVKLWARTFGGNNYDKARFGIQDADSNFVITGGTSSDDGDITNSHGNSELFVVKTDPAGNTIWFKVYGGTGYESGRHVLQTADGGYLISGYTNSHDFDVPMNRGHHDGWLLKLDTAGNVQWSNTYGGSMEDRIRCTFQTADGGYIFAGSSSSNDLQCTGNHGNLDFWAGRTDSVGNLIWSKLYGGTNDELALQVIAGNSNDLIITGYTSSGDGDVTNFHGDTDGWIVGTDTAGVLQWQSCLGGTDEDRLYRCRLLNNGNIVSCGYTRSNDFTLAGVPNGISASYWLLEMNPAHTIQWNYLTGGTLGDFGNELLVNHNDSTFVLMGDSRSNNMAVNGNHGAFDFWLTRLVWPTGTGLQQIQDPASGYYSAQSENLYFTSETHGIISLNIFDITGRKVAAYDRLQVTSGINTLPLPAVSNLPSGLYTAVVYIKDHFQTFRIPVTR
ncbi:MAG TPA: T9SS type A sorting domain-containing protein [Bacteroidia bacterium]|nr:T9SS type A sorting domain-containing protein [Bacteroidia bacterium]